MNIIHKKKDNWTTKLYTVDVGTPFKVVDDVNPNRVYARVKCGIPAVTYPSQTALVFDFYNNCIGFINDETIVYIVATELHVYE